MPSWVIHLKIAEEINKELKLNDSIYKFGSVMPDAEGYVVNNLSQNISYDISHYACLQNINEMKFILPNKDKFLMSHKKDINNDLILGYFSHILADYFFNFNTFKYKYICDDNENIIGVILKNNEDYYTDKRSIMSLKQNDFEKFSRKIYKNIDNKIKEEDIDKILESCKIIEEINYDREDIIKIIEYVNNIKFEYDKKDINEFDYSIYSEKDLENMLDNCIKYIKNEILNLYDYLNKFVN